MKKPFFKVLGVTIGGSCGFLYYYYVGCASGTCPISSNPYISVIYGGVLGYLFLDMCKKSEHGTD
jgi:hypothetical protein